MSSLDNILEKIQADAAKQADVILKDAKDEANSIIEKQKRMAMEKSNTIATRSEEEGDDLVERSISQAKLKARDMVLSAKEEVIGRTLELVKHHLNRLEEKDYIQYLINNLEQMDLNYRSEIRVPDRYREAVKKLNKGWNISDKPVKSGFQIHSDNIIYNSDFNSVVDARRDEFEAEIAQELFGE